MTDTSDAAAAEVLEPPLAVRQPLQIDLSALQKKAVVKAAAADPELQRKSRLAFSESFGAAAWLLGHDPEHRKQTLCQLESLIGDPLRLGQFKVYRKDGVPFAYASWALLNEAAEKQLRYGVKLASREWRCGDRIWLIDLVAPFGGREMVCQDLQDKLFKGLPLRMLGQPEDGGAMTVHPNARIRVRPATSADIPALIGLGRQMHAESAYSYLGFDEGKLQQLATRILASPITHCAFVADVGGDLVGMLCGHISETFFSRDGVASDMVFYVAQDRRGGMAAPRLVKAFRHWATERSARELSIGVSSGINTERAGSLLERLGLINQGGIYKERLS